MMLLPTTTHSGIYGMSQNSTPKKNTVNQYSGPALVLLTTVCATALAILAYRDASGLTTYLPLLLLTILTAAQILLYKSLQKQQRRTARYHQLGRKLVHIQTKKRRDENRALKILNHINSVVDQSPTHACIWQKPLRGFSGDLAMACESRCGKKYTLLADLTGHGIAAAMGAAPVASIFQATAKRGLSVAEIITELNNRLEQLLPSGFFCSTAVIMSDQGVITVCNAGLPDILITNETGALIDTIPSGQLPLGIETIAMDNVQLFTKKYPSPHQLYAVTDGMIESVSANDELFDMDTLTSLIATKNTGSGRIVDITDHFEAFTKGSALNDDISIVEVMIC